MLMENYKPMRSEELNPLHYMDINKMSILVDGKTVYKPNKLKIDRDINANWLLKELFKVVHIWVNGCGRSIMIFPKYGVKSCLAWNMLGGKFKVSKDFFTISGTFKIGDITRKSFRLVKIKERNDWGIELRNQYGLNTSSTYTLREDNQ